MAKKTSATVTETAEAVKDDIIENYGPSDDFGFSADFNIGEEYRPNPLIPPGKCYHANVTGVKFDPADQVMIWNFTLVENGGVLSDGETPVDGATTTFRNWFPKAGDENEMAKNGRMTKRQAKINMIKDYSEKLEIDMNTPTAIKEALMNHTWLGMAVNLEIEIRQYEGRFSNNVKSVSLPQ